MLDREQLETFAVVIEHDETTAAILVERVDDVAWLTAAEAEQLTPLNVPEILNHPQLRPPAGSSPDE